MLYSNPQHYKKYSMYVVLPFPHSNVITFQKVSLLDESTETEEDFACVTIWQASPSWFIDTGRAPTYPHTTNVMVIYVEKYDTTNC